MERIQQGLGWLAIGLIFVSLALDLIYIGNVFIVADKYQAWTSSIIMLLFFLSKGFKRKQ